MGILIAGVFLLFVAFATIWDQTHKKPESQATQETASSADESTSAEESSGTDANASTEPVPDNISVNEMQAKIDELQQQIADKDVTIADLQQQINGGVTFQEFLNLYFWPDGHTYKMAEDKKLYNSYACTDEYAVNVEDYTFPCNRTLQMTLDNGLTIHMLMTTDGQILWTPSPWLNQVQ